MNTLASVAVALTLSALTVTAANAGERPKVVAKDNSIATQLCVSAAAGSRIGMLIEIRDSGISKRVVTNKIHCNQEPLVTFVAKYGRNAEAMLDYLVPNNTNVTIRDLAKNSSQTGTVVVSGE